MQGKPLLRPMTYVHVLVLCIEPCADDTDAILDFTSISP